jgi:hypothetical protein
MKILQDMIFARIFPAHARKKSNDQGRPHDFRSFINNTDEKHGCQIGPPKSYLRLTGHGTTELAKEKIRGIGKRTRKGQKKCREKDAAGPERPRTVKNVAREVHSILSKTTSNDRSIAAW